MLVCSITGCISDDEPDGGSIATGEPLPEFSVVMNTGEEINTSSLKGKVSMIVFFNTGCGDCRQELPVVQRLWDFYEGNSDVKILLISREQSEASVSAYWAENGFTMPYSPQETREVYNLFAKSIIPRIYIADKDRIIKMQYGDNNMPDLATLKADIEKYLN